MITLFQAFVDQLQLTAWGLFFIWCLYLIKGKTLLDTLSRFFAHDYSKEVTSFLWLLGGTILRYYTQTPAAGIWNSLLEMDPYMGYVVLVSVVILHLMKLYEP